MIIVFALMGFASLAGSQSDQFHARRQSMVETQIRARGIRDPEVLRSMGQVPRHLFVPSDMQRFAYDDRPLPIGQGQTISQPYIVGYMTELLQVEPGHTVLEIGTGSGYQAAVLANIAKQVYSIEIVPELAARARRALTEAGYRNVEVRDGNGYLGWPERAPFARIVLTAAPPAIPAALVDQLAVGGILVAPVGTDDQEIAIVTKTTSGVAEKRTIGVRFVPMIRRPAARD